jgi:hypothetical protein
VIVVKRGKIRIEFKLSMPGRGSWNGKWSAHGGCIECDPNDDRGDDIYVFMLGSQKIQLCRSHLATLATSITRRFVNEAASRDPVPR